MTDRVKETNKKRVRVWEKMKTLEERKTENKNLLEETQKWKNEKMKKYRKIQKFMRNWEGGFLKNIHLHISKQQHKQ